ncbi:MAG: DUF599 family protein [Chromatiaceae bacterium]|jgi:uncharacterized membrane protein
MFKFDFTPLDWISLAWFAACWIGYTFFSGFRSAKRHRLQDALHSNIEQWIEVLYQRDLRIVDTSIIANIERNATFFASSSLLIIAGLVTVTGSTDKAITFLSDLPFVQHINRQVWELGILLMLLIFAYSFFTFTWCMRQWGFASILIGSAPLADRISCDEEALKRHGEALSRVVWLAIYNFNLGLRAYYFSIALLTWFLHPVLFILTSTWVVAVLYRREFRSRTLKALLAGLNRTG